LASAAAAAAESEKEGLTSAAGTGGAEGRGLSSLSESEEEESPLPTWSLSCALWLELLLPAGGVRLACSHAIATGGLAPELALAHVPKLGSGLGEKKRNRELVERLGVGTGSRVGR
jgi:hypothetical protein